MSEILLSRLDPELVEHICDEIERKGDFWELRERIQSVLGIRIPSIYYLIKEARLSSLLPRYQTDNFLKSFRTNNPKLRFLLHRLSVQRRYVPSIEEGNYIVSSRLPYQVEVEIKKEGEKGLRVILIPVFPEEACKERAENLTLEELEIQPSFRSVPFLIKDLVEEGEERLQVLGCRGLGKTFSIMKSAYELGISGYLPLILGFHKADKVYIVNPIRYMKKESENYRDALLLSKADFPRVLEKVRELKDKRPVLFLDDIHYMFDAVAAGRMRLEELCDIIEKVNKLPPNVVKVLVSEEPLCYYDELFNSERLHSILKDFGELSYEDTKEAILSRDYETLANAAIKRLWVNEIDEHSLSYLARAFGVKFYDDYAEAITNSLVNGSPRRLIKMINKITEIAKPERSMGESRRRIRAVYSGGLISFIKEELSKKRETLDDIVGPEISEKILSPWISKREICDILDEYPNLGRLILGD